jgi:hypothetical protein
MDLFAAGGRALRTTSHRPWMACAFSLSVLDCAGPRPAATESRLTLTHLGVAGWSLSDGTHMLLVDPYFSRAQDPANARARRGGGRGAHAPQGGPGARGP